MDVDSSIKLEHQKLEINNVNTIAKTPLILVPCPYCNK